MSYATMKQKFLKCKELKIVVVPLSSCKETMKKHLSKCTQGEYIALMVRDDLCAYATAVFRKQLVKHRKEKHFDKFRSNVRRFADMVAW